MQEDKRILRISEGTKKITSQMIFPYRNEVEVVYLPSSVEKIAVSAFEKCKNLKKIEFNNGLTSIERYAFNECVNLENIFIPKSVVNIEKRAFRNCRKLKRIKVDDENEVFDDFDSDVVIKKDEMRLLLGCANSKIPDGTKILSDHSFYGLDIDEIILPEGVEIIESCAIAHCNNLKTLNFPSSVHEMWGDCILHCPNIEVIKFNEKNSIYKDLGCNGVFYQGDKLVTACSCTTIPEGCIGIYNPAFTHNNIKHLHIPSTVNEIGFYADSKLAKLETITVSMDNENFSDGREYVANGIFKNTSNDKLSCNCLISKNGESILKGSLKSVIPDGVKAIGWGAFYGLPIKEIKLPKSIKIIDKCAFGLCEQLEKCELNEGIERINISAFIGDKKLKSITIPKSVQILEGGFLRDTDLEIIKVDKDNEFFVDRDCNVVINKETHELLVGCKNSAIPNGVEVISNFAFAGSSIEEVILPPSTKKIGIGAFKDCKKLKRIFIPESISSIGIDAFDGCDSLDDKTFNYKTKIEGYNNDLIYGAKVQYENAIYHFKDLANYDYSKCGFVGELIDGTIISANSKGEIYKITKEDLIKKTNKFNGIAQIDLKHIYKLEKWNQFDSLPSRIVIELMPYEEIELFSGNNKKNWQTLIKTSQYKTENEKSALFALAHALGVFSSSGSESKVATEFILEEILPNYTGMQLHSHVTGFDADNTPFNPEYAKFFMKNFDDFDFMIKNVKDLGNVNLLASSHNNFKKVQEIYPMKKVITRQDNERLTPKMVMDVLSQTKYENVKQETIELATYAGSYGYNQEQFDKMQKWYLEALSIPPNQLSIVCEEDDEDELITYEILEKSNPLGAILGDKTNCCQKIGSPGEECMRYGMTQPNSTFVVFREGEELIAQAWIWYDQETKQMTLDDIEVPNEVITNSKRYNAISKEMINCLNRLGVNLISGMNENFKKNKSSCEVNRVTIGLGCNKIGQILVKHYEKTKSPQGLTGYRGYSDALKDDGQITLAELQKEKIVLKEKNLEF